GDTDRLWIYYRASALFLSQQPDYRRQPARDVGLVALRFLQCRVSIDREPQTEHVRPCLFTRKHAGRIDDPVVHVGDVVNAHPQRRWGWADLESIARPHADRRARGRPKRPVAAGEPVAGVVHLSIEREPTDGHERVVGRDLRSQALDADRTRRDLP